MPSNALSQKSFSTKTPVICKPPPWPPFVPPPPIPKATFFAFATIDYDYAGVVAKYAASCKLRYPGALITWLGQSSKDPDVQRIVCRLWPIPLQPVYHISVDYWFDSTNHRLHTWYNNTFPNQRPYVGITLQHHIVPTGERATVVVRETPA